MNLYYKIIEHHTNERLLVVRYYTDILTEEDLRVGEGTTNGVPIRCKTDISISIPIPEFTEFGMHKYLTNIAPIPLLKKLEAEKSGNTAILEITNTEKLIGKVFKKTDEQITFLKNLVKDEANPLSDETKALYMTPEGDAPLLRTT